jgi:cysteine synthase
VGKWFPTGCHKVGAAFGCLAPRLVTGQFDPSYHKAVWPSTGNFCRGGAYNSQLLACDSIAILPAGMSRERFDWLSKIAGEVIATPGCESNVKEIFDKTWELKRTREDVVVFNQFEEMGNYMWHYNVTGPAIEAAYERVRGEGGNFAGACFCSGSAGCIGCGDYLKQRHPFSKLAAGEAIQCPTILENGFGSHRIEGIGDKHVPWIHNVKNTDMAIGVDDRDSMALLRLFNEPAGLAYMKDEAGVAQEDLDKLPLMGLSGISNVICAIKFAKYYELTERDVVATVLTDSVEMYASRIEELREAEGAYTHGRAAADHARSLLGQRTDNMAELSYKDRRRVHNLKYYTWVEQQGRSAEELDEQWHSQEKNFLAVQAQAAAVDALIDDFNERTGLLSKI